MSSAWILQMGGAREDGEPMIRVLVVDDQPIMREGLALVLGEQPGIAVLGAASSAPEAVELARAQAPDVILLDLELPGQDAVEALPALAAAAPAARVLIFTAYGSDERLVE